MAKEVILNIIREVSKFDFVDYPNKKRAPKDAKFKIVFYKPPPKTKDSIWKSGMPRIPLFLCQSAATSRQKIIGLPWTARVVPVYGQLFWQS